MVFCLNFSGKKKRSNQRTLEDLNNLLEMYEHESNEDRSLESNEQYEDIDRKISRLELLQRIVDDLLRKTH